MKDILYLHVPTYGELSYRRKILNDPDTMSYNKGYNLGKGYDSATGCIDFPEKDWANWYDYFCNNRPTCFYAYIARKSDGAFIGEVNLHLSRDWYDMGIVLESKYRGKGYATKALRLLLAHAFENLNANAVHNDFEETRLSAIQTHLSAGFKILKQENGMVEFLITKEEYFNKRKK